MDYNQRPTAGRPRNVERREKIAEKAIELFAKQGYEGTSLNDIAGACDISPALLRHYFARKPDVLAEIINTHGALYQEAIADLVTAARAAADCRTFLHMIGRRYADYISEHQWYYIFWLQEGPSEANQPHNALNMMQNAHARVIETLMNMRDFRGDEVAARMALRVLMGTVFHSTLMELRVGLPLVGDREAFFARLASIAASEITA